MINYEIISRLLEYLSQFSFNLKCKQGKNLKVSDVLSVLSGLKKGCI